MALIRRNREVLPSHRAVAAPYGRPRAITAAATTMPLGDRRAMERWRLQQTGVVASWQTEAWLYYSSIGEIAYAFNYLADLISRVRLYAGVRVGDEGVPVPVSDAVALSVRPVEGEEGLVEETAPPDAIDPRLAQYAQRQVERLTDTATMLRKMALGIMVPGETYLALIDGRWQAYSTSELRVDASGQVFLRESRAVRQNEAILPPNTPVGRIWRQHPEYGAEPDSSMLPLRDVCEELLLMNRLVRTSVRARMGAGILFVPEELTVSHSAPTSSDTDADVEEEADEFEKELMETMTAPIQDESNGAAIVPMLVRGPAELGKEIRHISVPREVDKALIERSQELMERLLAGLAVPKEVVSGFDTARYSTAVVIDDNLYKAHVEPLAMTLCDGFTEVYLKPMLRAAESQFSPDEVARIVVWYDPSAIVVRPNRSADATTGYTNYLLSGASWRDAHGFSDTDAPDEEEIAFRLAVEKSTIPPEIAQTLLMTLLPEVLGEAREEALAENPIPDELAQALETPAPGSQAPTAPGRGPSPAPGQEQAAQERAAGAGEISPNGSLPAPAGR